MSAFTLTGIAATSYYNNAQVQSIINFEYT